MNAVQFYESIVQDNDTNIAAHFIVVPRRSLPVPEGEVESEGMSPAPPESENLIGQLGLHPIKQLRPEDITTVLSAILAYAPHLHGKIVDTSFEAQRQFDLDKIIENPDSLNLPKGDKEFISYLVDESIVPMEQSPLSTVSLQNLGKASGITIGAYMGFVVAGSTPLLFITVPAGMILCGASYGIAFGLQEGLKARITRLISKAQGVSRKSSKGRKK